MAGQDGEGGCSDLCLIHVPMADRNHPVAFAPDDERRALDAIQIAPQFGIVRKLPGKPGEHLPSLEHGLDRLRGWHIGHQFVGHGRRGIGEEGRTRSCRIELEEVWSLCPREAQTQGIDQNQGTEHARITDSKLGGNPPSQGCPHQDGLFESHRLDQVEIVEHQVFHPIHLFKTT